MRINRFFIIFLFILAGLITFSYSSQPDTHPIVRASISKIRGYLAPSSTEPSYLERLHKQIPTKQLFIPKEEVIETKQQIKVFEEKIQTKEEHINLNLALPDDWEAYEWKKPAYYSSYPNFFVPKGKDKRFGVSGALHLDESDEAQEGPLEKSILGAEVELQWRLP